MGNIVELKKCTSSFEAQVIKSRLESEGIPAMVTNECMSALYANAVSAFNPRILVNEEDFAKAKEIIESENSESEE